MLKISEKNEKDCFTAILGLQTFCTHVMIYLDLPSI